jgi:hypothetical protein
MCKALPDNVGTFNRFFGAPWLKTQISVYTNICLRGVYENIGGFPYEWHDACIRQLVSFTEDILTQPSMIKLKKSLGALLLAFGLTASAVAAPISGEILFGPAPGTSVSINAAANTVSFTNAGAALVVDAYGDFAGLLGSGANFQNFTYDPLVALTIWNVGASASFYLDSITEITETFDGSGNLLALSLVGSGVASLSGYEDTRGSWSFSADRSSGTARFSWSSTAQVPSVPDGGTTAALLGLGLVAVGIVSRRRA